jgi:hypothetical protein
LTLNYHGLSESVPYRQEYTVQDGEEFVNVDSLGMEGDNYRAEGMALINQANIDFVVESKLEA